MIVGRIVNKYTIVKEGKTLLQTLEWYCFRNKIHPLSKVVINIQEDLKSFKL